MKLLLQDMRYAYRMLIKNPGFSAVAVLALALGIGANTAIFSVVNAVLLRPLPYEEPDRLVSVARGFEGGRSDSVSMTKFVFWRDNNQVFDGLGAYDILGAGHNLTGGDRPERIASIRVSTELFPVLGVEPQAGRNFIPAEGVPGAAPVAIISDGLWKRRFGGEPSLIGESIPLSGTPHTVVGIMPPGFGFTPVSDVWTPLQPVADAEDQANVIALIGRLKPGMTPESAGAGLEALAVGFREQYPALMNEQESISAIGYHENLVDDIRPALLVLLGAVGFVLLIACANVANLLLSRAASRRQEIAVRTALGAPRVRLIRQLLTESAMLALVGAAIGLMVSYWGLQLLLSMSPANFPELMSISIDARVMLFTLGIALATGLLFGVVPALQISKQNLRDTLHESGTRTTAGAGGRRIRGALVVAEIALSLVLLIGAALLLRSFSQLRDVDPGFEAPNVLTMQLSMTGGRYDTSEDLDGLFRSALDRIRMLPGVEAAATVTNLPTEPGPDLPFEIEGRQMEEGEFLGAQWRSATPEYFEAMGIPLVRGRVFTEGEAPASTPVILINETLAARDFPDQDPIGQMITVGRVMGPGFEDPPRQIVGIVGDTREFGLDQPAPATLFVPYPQVPDQLIALANTLLPVVWVVRTREEPALDERAGSRGDSRCRQQSACVQYSFDGAGHGRVDGTKRVQHVATIDLCRGRSVPGRHRHLRHDVLCGQPAHARNRATDGAGRGWETDAGPRGPPGHDPRRDRSRHRTRRSLRADTRAGGLPVRDRRDRHGNVRWCGSDARGDRVRGLLLARETRYTSRSYDCSAIRIARTISNLEI